MPYIDRAKLIRVTPKINEILDDSAKIKKLEKELAKARKMIEELKAHTVSSLEANVVSQAPQPPRYQSGDTFRSGGSVDTFRSSRSGSIGGSMDRSSHSTGVLSISDYGYDEIAQSRNYVMPGQTPSAPAQKIQDKPPIPTAFDGEEPDSPHYKQYTVELNPGDEESDESSRNKEHPTPADTADELEISEGSFYEEPLPRDDFKLDAVDEEEARKCVQKFMKGKDWGDSSTEGELFGESGRSLDMWDDSSKDSNSLPLLDLGVKKESTNATSRTDDESESYDGPPASYKDVSFKFGSKLSRPDTLGVDTIPENESNYGTQEGRDGRTNEISWDTMGLDAKRPEHIGQPLRALKSLAEQDLPIPTEVTIICTSTGNEEPGLQEKHEDALNQVAFLKSKLESADDIIESVFKDLERARLCIHDMVHRNVQLAAKLNEKRRQDVKEEYEEGEINVEQYWLLKGSMYVGLFFFFTGGYELFMASAMLIWLILEANLS